MNTRHFNTETLCLIISAILIICIAGLFSWHHGLGSFADDSVSYILMAQCWSPYIDPAKVLVDACQYESYPPFFPLLLAYSGLSHSLALAHFFIAICFTTSTILTYFWAKTICHHKVFAYGISLIVVLMPASWINLLGILSENLYLCLSLAILLYYEKYKICFARYQSILILALLLCCLLLTRTIGISLILAFVICHLPPYKTLLKRNTIYATMLSLLPALMWYSLHSPGGEVSYGSDIYTTLQAIINGQTSLVQVFSPQIQNLYLSWFSSFLIYWHNESELNFILIAGFGCLAFIGMLIRIYQHKVDGWYILLYLLILIIWPYPGQIPRFLYAILPIMIVHAIYALTQLPLLKKHLSFVTLISIFSILVTLLPATLFIYQRAQYISNNDLINYAHNADVYRHADLKIAEQIGLQHESLFQDMQRIKQTTPQDAKIMWFTQSYIPLLANRKSTTIPTYQNRSQFLQAVARQKADYILLSRLHPRDTRLQTNGLDWYPTFESFTDVVWRTTETNHTRTLSLFLKINKKQLQTLINQGLST